jgi:Tfp pilus assembly protein PilX
MDVLPAVIVLVALVALVVLRPLMAGAREERTEDERRAALEAAKEAKYREIRDAELDLRTGKLSEEDHQKTDQELRAQAIAILREIDALEGAEERGERSPLP